MGRPHHPYTAVSRSLPILRGWAIVWIVMYHLLGNTKGYAAFSETPLWQGGFSIESLLQLAIAAGESGVSIFLVISGFGLTASWWKRYGSQPDRRLPLADFWRKRIWRIFPLFWAAIALSTVLYLCNSTWAPFGQGLWNQPLTTRIGAFLATITTARNIIPDYYYFLNGAWWYVGLALQLYLIFPYLIRLGQRWGGSRLLAGSCLISLVYRTVCALAPLSDLWTIIAFDLFPARLFEFSLGIYLAITLLTSDRCDRWLYSLLFTLQGLTINLSCFVTGVIFKWSNYWLLHIFDELLIAVGLFGACIYLAQFSGVTMGPAKTAGHYSYGIYLTHMNIYLALWPLASAIVPSYWPRFFIVTLACCCIGAGFESLFSWLQDCLRTRPLAKLGGHE